MSDVRSRHVPQYRGDVLALGGATLAGLNGSLGRFLLDDGMSAWRLTQMRTVIVVAVLGLAVAAWRPALARLPREDLGRMVVMAAALSGAQAGYFFAVSRMEIGVALALQYTYPLMILVWTAVAHHRPVGRGMWAAVAACLTGGVLAVDALGGTLDALGILSALGSAVVFCIYILVAERVGGTLHPATVTLWSFGLAALLWVVILPVWLFPFELVDTTGSAATALGVGIVGTLLPFGAFVAAVRFAPAPRVAILLTFEIVAGAAFAFVLHDERLAAAQLLGVAIIVAGVAWVQSRPAAAATTVEAPPA